MVRRVRPGPEIRACGKTFFLDYITGPGSSLDCQIFYFLDVNLLLTKGDNFYTHFWPLRGGQITLGTVGTQKIAISGRTFESDHHHGGLNPTNGGLNESRICLL